MTLSRKNWDAVLVSRDVDEKLSALESEGIISEVFPEIQAIVGFGGAGTAHKDLWWHTKLVVKQTIPRPVLLRWAALFHDVGKPSTLEMVDGNPTFRHHEEVSADLFWRAARRVGFFTPKERTRIEFIIRHLGDVENYYSGYSDTAVRRISNKLGDRLEDVFAVARADITTSNPTKRRHIINLTSELYHRIQTVRKLDAVPPALPKGLPKGLGLIVQDRTGLKGEALGAVMTSLKERVEAGELPRGADYEVYLRALNLL